MQKDAIIKVGYLGPEGTYSHAVATERFGADAEFIPSRSIRAIFEMLRQGELEHGIVPLENSTEGAVRATLDCFMSYATQSQDGDASLKITGEQLMKIDLNLLGASMDGVRTVYAHEQAIAQARNWLESNFPDVELIAVGSNGMAAQRAGQDSSCVAIASTYAASIYGLKVLAPNIQDDTNNTTRFVVLGSEGSQPSGRDKTSLMASAKHKPGALLEMLQPLSDNGINMLCLESRPIPDVSWEYEFFIEVEGHHQAEPLASVLKQLSEFATIRVLGSYPIMDR